jgi:hypothetical protein
MFEKMRQPGFSRLLVRRPDLVPDHLGDHGGQMILDHDEPKPVRQGENRRAEYFCRRLTGAGQSEQNRD